MYLSSADFNDYLWLKDKSCKTFNNIVTTRSVIFIFYYFGGWGMQAGCPSPLGALL
jgi:hypothetical protein